MSAAYLAFLGLLILAWSAFLGSTFVRRRAESNSGQSIQSFNRQLSLLGGAKPAAIDDQGLISVRPSPVPVPIWATPITVNDARQRRIEVIFTLVGAAVAALLLGVLITRWVLLLHVMIDVTLISYLFSLARSQALAAERAEKVVHLDDAPSSGVRRALAERAAAGYDEDVFEELEAPIAVGAGTGFRVLGNSRPHR